MTEDERLTALFRAGTPALADRGFSDSVLRRVARRAWRRRLLLAVAALTGAAIAFEPLWSLSAALGQALAGIALRWTDLAWVLQNPVAIVAGALLVIALSGLAQED